MKPSEYNDLSEEEIISMARSLLGLNKFNEDAAPQDLKIKNEKLDDIKLTDRYNEEAVFYIKSIHYTFPYVKINFLINEIEIHPMEIKVRRKKN